VSGEVFLALTLLPIIVGVILLASRMSLPGDIHEEPPHTLRIARVALSIGTAATLGTGAIVGIDAAKRYLPDDDADAPIQLIGVIGLAYAIVAALVMLGLLATAARDIRGLIRRQ
jgi:hypothetical protein